MKHSKREPGKGKKHDNHLYACSGTSQPVIGVLLVNTYGRWLIYITRSAVIEFTYIQQVFTAEDKAYSTFYTPKIKLLQINLFYRLSNCGNSVLHCHCFFSTTADDKPVLDDLLCMSYTGWDGRDTHFRLMDQLQSHWRRLAIALKFRLCDTTIMEHKDDPVFYLLSEWLRGANQERDSRPVTWRTLITALRDANVQKEADMLEIHFVEIFSMGIAHCQGECES